MNKTTKTLVNAIRYTVKAEATYAAFIAENNVTREDYKFYAETLAGLAFPGDTVQTYKDDAGKKIRTKYGKALDAAKQGLLRNLPETEKPKSVKPEHLLTGFGLGALADATDEEIVEWVKAEIASREA